MDMDDDWEALLAESRAAAPRHVDVLPDDPDLARAYEADPAGGFTVKSHVAQALDEAEAQMRTEWQDVRQRTARTKELLDKVLVESALGRAIEAAGVATKLRPGARALLRGWRFEVAEMPKGEDVDPTQVVFVVGPSGARSTVSAAVLAWAASPEGQPWLEARAPRDGSPGPAWSAVQSALTH